MSMTVVPNSGLFNDPALDNMRCAAVIATPDVSKLPEALVYYIRALERRLLDVQTQQKQEIAKQGWAYKSTDKGL